ncbi:DUF3995 domain-containing protein [uncultured Winogradskyella sp.]|uniref:DUF3995 domain-containing protein n=1 Tax=Winogradskyella sp. 4-2091 TaxID=3381659 RepID=UPI0026056D5C|nr:DUF3995 domain-containing protein [uncultured Winogradskyella sp.]
MMISILSLILILIFSFLSLVHFYWLFGGKWALKSVIPTHENETNSPSIPKFATLLVALILALFALVYVIKAGFLQLNIPNAFLIYACWIIPSLFIIRAIGDFNYVGLFKKVKHTNFAKADSKLFIPLCLILGVFGLIIQVVSL